MRRNRLYGSVIHYTLWRYLFGMTVVFGFASRHNGVHDKIVGFDNRRMNYGAELLIVLHLKLAATEAGLVVSLVLLTVYLSYLGRVWLPFGDVHVNGAPSIVHVIWWLDCRVVNALLALIYGHLWRSHSSSCCRNCMLVRIMCPNHCGLGILWWTMWSNAALNGVMVPIRVAMSNCHVHSLLYVIFGLLRELWLVAQVLTLYTCLVETSRHTHNLSMMCFRISLIIMVGSISSCLCNRTRRQLTSIWIWSVRPLLSIALIPWVRSVLLVSHARVLGMDSLIMILDGIICIMLNSLKLWPIMNSLYLYWRRYRHCSLLWCVVIRILGRAHSGGVATSFVIHGTRSLLINYWLLFLD